MTDFRNQILALASPANVQITLYPQGVCIGDELVCDFDRHKQEFITKYRVTTQQLNVIRELDEFLEELSGPQNEEFWCDRERLTDDPRWEHIRELARAVLNCLNWDYSQPQKNGAAYVFDDRVEINVEDGEDKSGTPKAR